MSLYYASPNSHYEKFSDGTVKCIDDEIPFEIPESWEWVRLKDISNLNRGKSQHRPRNDQSLFANGNIPLVQTGDVANANLYISSCKSYYNEKGLNQSKLWEKGTLCMTIAANIGDVAILGFDACFPDSVVGFQSYKPINDNLFFLYALKCYKDILDKMSYSTAQKNINVEILQNLIFPLPPLSEQQRIVAKIEELMPLVNQYSESQDKMNKLNEAIYGQLKKSVLQEAIQGKLVPQIAEEGDASELLKQIELEKQKLVKEGKLKKKDLVSSTIFRGDDNRYYEKVNGEIECIDEEIPFEIPDSWRWCRLSCISEIIGGYAFPSQDIKGDCGTRVIRISDFNEFGWVNTKIARYNDKEELTQYELKNGDILIAMTGGTVGKSLYVTNLPERMLLNQRVAIIRNHFVESSYIDVLIKSPLIQDVVNEKKNSTNDNISMGDISGFLIPLPSHSEQRRIIAKIKELIPLVELCDKKKTNLVEFNV